MNKENKVLYIQELSSIYREFNLLVELVNKPVTDMSHDSNNSMIKNKINSITKHFTNYIPEAIKEAISFSVNITEVNKFYSDFLQEQSRLLATTEDLFKSSILSLYNIMNEGYIEPDMFYKDTIFIFNYWIKYVEMLVKKSIIMPSFYNNLNNYNSSMKTLQVYTQPINYLQKYMKYKNKFLVLRKQNEEFNNII